MLYPQILGSENHKIKWQQNTFHFKNAKCNCSKHLWVLFIMFISSDDMHRKVTYIANSVDQLIHFLYVSSEKNRKRKNKNEPIWQLVWVCHRMGKIYVMWVKASGTKPNEPYGIFQCSHNAENLNVHCSMSDAFDHSIKYQVSI